MRRQFAKTIECYNVSAPLVHAAKWYRAEALCEVNCSTRAINVSARSESKNYFSKGSIWQPIVLCTCFQAYTLFLLNKRKTQELWLRSACYGPLLWGRFPDCRIWFNVLHAACSSLSTSRRLLRIGDARLYRVNDDEGPWWYFQYIILWC